MPLCWDAGCCGGWDWADRCKVNPQASRQMICRPQRRVNRLATKRCTDAEPPCKKERMQLMLRGGLPSERGLVGIAAWIASTKRCRDSVTFGDGEDPVCGGQFHGFLCARRPVNFSGSGIGGLAEPKVKPLV